MLKTLLAVLGILGVVALAGCSDEGSFEQAGEGMDSSIEEATQGEVDRDDGLLENAGEALDEVTGRESDDPVDAIHDATDDNPN